MPKINDFPHDRDRKIRSHGYYNDHEKLAHDAAGFPGDCFLTINRLAPTIPATTCSTRCKKGACTKAKDIVRRTLLYGDGDPVRPAGTPSTDAQHRAAIDLMTFIAGQVPFPRPLIGDTGNGACAFWEIDLPPDSTLPKRVLKTIKAKWETPAVSIDLTVASLARIGRLLGTNNYKGGSAGRQSTIIDSPDKLELLTEEVMEAFAPLPQEQTEKRRVQQVVTSWTFGRTYEEQIANVKALLEAKAIPHAMEKSPDSRGTLCTWFRFADCRPSNQPAAQPASDRALSRTESNIVTSLESKEACVRPPEPLGEEAAYVLMIIASGLSHALNCHLFRRWLTTADVTGLSLIEIRQRFERADPWRYLPKSTIARLLAGQ